LKLLLILASILILSVIGIQESFANEPKVVPMPNTFELDPDTLVGYNIRGGTIKDMKTIAEDNSFLISINAISDGQLEIYISPEYLNTSYLYDTNDFIRYSVLIDGEKVDVNKLGSGNGISRLQIDFEQGDSNIVILDSMVEEFRILLVGFFVLVCGIIIVIIFIIWRKRK